MFIVPVLAFFLLIPTVATAGFVGYKIGRLVSKRTR